MKIVILANHYPVASGRYAADAFRRLGHEVVTVGPAHGRTVWGLELPERYVWAPDATTIPADADLLIVMDTDPALLEAARNVPMPGIVWTVDNHVRDVHRPWFSHYFLAHKAVSMFPFPANSTHLPCAYDPVWFTPSPIPYSERAYDVCVIGVMYPQRWEIVQALRAAGLKVLAGTGLVYDAYRDAYHSSRVALNISFNGDLGQRVFETAALGCAVVTDYVRDLDDLGYAGSGLLKYAHGVDAAVGAVELALHDSDIARQRSMEWVKPHTWDARAEEVITWYKSRI